MSQPKKKKSPASTNSSPAVEPAPVVVTPVSVKPATRRALWVWPVLVVAGLVVLLGGGGAYAYASQAQSIVRGVTVAGVPVGGKSTDDALALVEQAWKTYQGTPLTFQTPKGTIKLDVVTVSATADGTATELATFSPVEAVNAARAFGHHGTWWQQMKERVSGLLGRPHMFGLVSVSPSAIEDALKSKTSDLITAAHDAAITMTDSTPSVVAEKNGQQPDTHAATLIATRQARILSTATIPVQVKTVAPTFVNNSELTALATAEVPAVLARAPWTLKLADQTWTMNRTKLSSLLGFRLDAAHQTHVGFDHAKTVAYLESLRSSTDIVAQDARFQVVDGKVQAFATSQPGRTMDTLATLAKLNQALDGTSSTVDIVYAVQQPTSDTVATNNLGITELVAIGTTNFAGSPSNRRYNLTYGAKLLNGLLIQPGETFSLVGALGHIDEAHGWKSELVIKGPKITPEFGGGLCQVATTLFRAALNAGLPIVERRNHSLRIHYYEPPVGLDATIYEPKPDLRFTNDYMHPLLLQTEVVGNNITFRLYGTKDGRSVDLPTPKVYNYVSIPATKTVETTELKPGEKKCQTPGHPGADAIVTYTVTKADGTKVAQVFKSHYTAIGVICSVGKKAAPKPKPTTNTNTATNTNVPVVNTNASTNTNVATNTNSAT